MNAREFNAQQTRLYRRYVSSMPSKPIRLNRRDVSSMPSKRSAFPIEEELDLKFVSKSVNFHHNIDSPAKLDH